MSTHTDALTDDFLDPSTIPESDPTLPLGRRWRLLGVEVGYPIGIAASKLTSGSDRIDIAARRGFSVLTHKTLRSREWPEHDPPNWVLLQNLREPLPVGVDHTHVVGRSAGDGALLGGCAISMANSYGVGSPSPKDWCRDIEKAQGRLANGKLLIVSVQGSPELFSGQQLADDFAAAATLAESAGASAIELNLSCPNTVDRHGSSMQPLCESSSDTREVVGRVRDALRPDTSLVAKLSYLPANRLTEVVRGIAQLVDGVSGINTLPIRVEDENGLSMFPGRRDAGVSGVALQRLSLDFTRTLAELKAVHGWSFDIIAMGGVTTPADVRSLLDSGAAAVQVVTAATVQPAFAARAAADSLAASPSLI